MKNILVTGGVGFIGSHTSVMLLEEGNNVIILDNLLNSNYGVLEKIIKLGDNGKLFFYRKSLGDNLDNIFIEHEIDAVIHFAGLKSVSESVNDPLYYYENNVCGTINLLRTMERFNCNKLIFSSSATVYGNQEPPLSEDKEIGRGITNPYGETKHMLEKIMMDYVKSNLKCKIVSLRYFNPVGAHISGEIGEKPNGRPNNLMPHIVNVGYNNLGIDKDKDNDKDNDKDKEICVGNSYLSIYGDDYDTRDGTCVRDYIHVMDVARCHILAIKKIDSLSNYEAINVGIGEGTSVLELVNIFEKVNNVFVPYKFVGRRNGDLERVYCDTLKAEMLLGFKAEYSVERMCEDAWFYKLKSMAIIE